MATITKTHIRPLNPEDMPSVLSIERLNGMAYWDKKDFYSALRPANHGGIVAELPGSGVKLAGFAVYGPCQGGMNIYNFAVHPDCEGLGIGTALIAKLKKSKLRPGKCEFLEIDIRESNLGAQLFLRNLGFRAIKVVRQWYKHPQPEDAYKFQYAIATAL